MLIEKEVIRPGTFWYRDEATGLPRKLVVTSELTKYWHDQGNAMLGAGLTVPVPCEHDADSHPMTPADRLKSNAGWVKEYRMKGDRLYGALDIQDADVARKLPGTIRWTSPWINSFTDGQGKEWKNVISHLALTTRPRIVEQAPFGSVAAALSMATETRVGGDLKTAPLANGQGFCLSIAGRLGTLKRDHRLAPRYPMAFSMWSGAALGDGDMPPPKAKKPNPNGGAADPSDAEYDSEFEDSDDDGEMDADEGNIDLEPLGDPAGDVKMEELLCDLLGALGIQCEHSGNPEQFKRELYNAAMTKIHELTGKGEGKQQQPAQPNRTNPPGQPPNSPKPPAGAGGSPPNPLIQQEQQPMYMSLEEIQKLDEPLRSVALSMYNESQQYKSKAAEYEKRLNSLTDIEIKKASEARAKRINFIVKFMPRVKPDLDAMLALPSMALSMGEKGMVIDPMSSTLTVLEKGLQELPRLLTSETSSVTVMPQPTEGEMTEDEIDAAADLLSRAAGVAPAPQARAG